MSYKHNNLIAMRQNYWNDRSENVQNEKQLLRQILMDEGIFQYATLDDARYLFFSLPSIVIVKAYAAGFYDYKVKQMVIEFIQQNRLALMGKSYLKIQYQMSSLR